MNNSFNPLKMIRNFSLLSLTIMFLAGCAQTPLHFDYDHSAAKLEPLPFQTNVQIHLGKDVPDYYKELTGDLQNAISRDLQASGFYTTNTAPADLTATFQVNEMRMKQELWGLLWLGFSYLGAPAQLDKATVDIDLTLSDADQKIIGQYSARKKIARWQGLYYRNYLTNPRDKRFLLSTAMTETMDDLKIKMAAEQSQIVQAVRSSSGTQSAVFANFVPPVRPEIEGISIAVLPFANETTDLAAGELARLLFTMGMQEKGYQVLDNEIVDAKLRDLGISDGGQLNSISASELTEALQVEGLVYGTLRQAEYSTKAVSSTKRATLAIRIEKDGQTVFDDQETSAESQTGSSLNIAKSFANQIIDKTSQKAFAKYHGHPLEQQIETAVYKLQDRIPGQRQEKSGWTCKAGNQMIGTTVIPTFQGPGLGFRSWFDAKNGFGLEVQPSWDFSDILFQMRAMRALNTKINARTYLLFTLGAMKVHETTSFSYGGITSETDYKLTIPTIAIGLGWEKLLGIRKNHGLSIEGGLQLGKGTYKYTSEMHDIPYVGDYTYEGTGTYKVSPLYIGASYCWYFKK